MYSRTNKAGEHAQQTKCSGCATWSSRYASTMDKPCRKCGATVVVIHPDRQHYHENSQLERKFVRAVKFYDGLFAPPLVPSVVRFMVTPEGLNAKVLCMPTTSQQLEHLIKQSKLASVAEEMGAVAE